MESINEVILFCSSVSQACIPVIQAIKQYNLPVEIVRLDTTEYRTAAKNGPHFQIRAVPTLIVTYRDGNLQLFVGQVKALEWLKMVVSSQRAPEISTSSTAPQYNKETKISLSSDEDEEYEVPMKKSIKSKKSGKSIKSSKKSRHPSSHPKPKKSDMTSGGLYGSNKKKKPAVEFYSSDEGDNNVDIEFINDRSAAPPTEGLRVGAQALKSTRMKGSSLAEMAKQMIEDRNKTLGYDEKNLPSYN